MSHYLVILWLIHDWAKSQKPDYCLKFYWKSNEIDYNFAMPIVRRVMAATVGQDLVAVQPLKGPTGHLFYLDHQYGELDHPTPNYILAADPVDENPNITIAKPRNPDRQEILRKWIDSGLLDNVGDDAKQSLAALYEAQSRQLLE